MYGNEFRFYEGERKEVTAIIRSRTSNEVVIITSATFEVERVRDHTIIQKGTCEINRNEASVLLEITEQGIYGLKITAYVGREVIIEKAEIKVV